MPDDFYVLAFYVSLGILTGFLMIFANWFVTPHTRPSKRRDTPYECGDPPLGSGWAAYNVRYYVFALLFVVFEVEAIFLFAYVSVFKTLGFLGLIEVFAFIAVLLVGLFYAWKKGVLRWI